jgi:CheY-like chemotaxis protein
VLVVDDEPLQRRALHRQLQELDLRIDEAASGEQALALMSRQSYDLVILDLHMNGIDGYEAALRVGRGEVPLNQNVCIVAHSAENNLGARMKARKAGMHGFVPKSTAQLPLWQALAGALAQRAATPPLRARPAGCRVLIADDSLPSRRALATSLGQAGMHVVQARHGGEVLVHLQQKSAEAAPFDAVLLDLHMPVLDGMETARAIRQLMPGMRHTPLIAVTACEDAATRSAAREAGIDAFVTKPVELGALLRVLGQGAQVPTLCAPPPAASAGPLLDLPRLQTYKRMNRLDELLDDYLPDIRQLAEKLPACADRADRQQCLELLHSLLGMSGEAGARALYQATRKVYRPLLEEQTWPVQHQWAQDLLRLAQRSEQALRAHAREPEPVQTPN